MNILIAGGSGFIGTELVRSLKKEHKITVLGRNIARLEELFDKDIQKVSWDRLFEHEAGVFDVIINLSGTNIGAKRWSPSVKKSLIVSRTKSNAILTQWLIAAKARPLFLCANAVGIFGLQANGDAKAFDEDTPLDSIHSKDFLHKIGMAWQKSLILAKEAGISVTTLRFGVVLKKGQGMLKKLELPYNIGLGSILADGQQVISWIHIDDVVAAVKFVLKKPSLLDDINLTSPNPVSQKEFAHVFAAILKRPLFLKMPAWLIKLLFGEMGECLLLKGQRVLPKRLEQMGYQFKYPLLEKALAKEYSK